MHTRAQDDGGGRASAGVVSTAADELRPGGRYRRAGLAGAALAGADLSACDFSGADLTGADLSAADLSGALFVGADLTGANLSGTNLREAQFVDATMVGVDAGNCVAQHAGFGGARLDDANLFGADLSDASLVGASLTGVDARTAILVSARLRQADLTRASLSRADLSGADLFGARVDGAVFSDAVLRGAHIRGMRGISSAGWIGVDISDVDFTGAYLARRAIMDENYLHEFRTASRRNAWLYQLWHLTSDCGRSLLRWGLVIVLVAVLFAVGYTFVDVDYGEHGSSVGPLYFSLVTLTTLGYGDVVPASSAASFMVMAEVLSGYVMLGGLLSIFATRMGTRAE